MTCSTGSDCVSNENKIIETYSCLWLSLHTKGQVTPTVSLLLSPLYSFLSRKTLSFLLPACSRRMENQILSKGYVEKNVDMFEGKVLKLCGYQRCNSRRSSPQGSWKEHLDILGCHYLCRMFRLSLNQKANPNKILKNKEKHSIVSSFERGLHDQHCCFKPAQ